MLASDEEGATLDALGYSLASEIVELVVLTADDAFLQTLREAVGSARRIWHVPSAEKVSDLLVAGEVGILVLDVDALSEAPTVFIGQIKRQFPDLVVVVAGSRDAETSLAGLISAGSVYRFIHKPMSPGRAKLFADAAVKKYDEQRRRAAATPPPQRHPRSNHAWLIFGAIAAVSVIVLVWWAMHRRTEAGLGASPATGRPAPAESPLLAQAAAALAANRLTEPGGDNALDLYLEAEARNPADSQARAGLAEVRERLLARAENALLEERLDDAAAAIDTAGKSGVESGRIAFLTAQLAKSREHLKTMQTSVRAHNESKADADQVASLLKLSAERISDGHLIDPERDSALFYAREASRLDPNGGAVQEALGALAAKILGQVRIAIAARDFAGASAWLEAARGIAVPSNIDAARDMLATARRQADAEVPSQLLRNATERLQQDRLLEPANDSAKYYLLALQNLDPGNAGLPGAVQDMGNRLVAKARRALALGEFEAARGWLDETAAIGFASPELASAQHDLDTAVAAQQFMTNIAAANDLTLVKSVKPLYPKKAEANKTQGWVELDFTVAESGAVKDITVHAASTPGVFDDAAIAALSQWRYKPVLRDAKPAAQRARIRIRFVLEG